MEGKGAKRCLCLSCGQKGDMRQQGGAEWQGRTERATIRVVSISQGETS